jgi:kynurenine formamidase
MPAHDPPSILDLTQPLTAGIEIYTEDDYRDPPFECREWCSVTSRGYRVSELRMGTQTGTHIDAPAHFDAQGATLEALPVERLIGRYCLLDLPAHADRSTVTHLCRAFAGEPILFVRTPHGETAELSSEALDPLLALPPVVWVVDGAIELKDAPALAFYRAVASAGKYLVENLDHETAGAVRPGGEVFALPLALVGTSGAPCRVLVREFHPSGC